MNRITVITVTYNAESTIESTINSVLKQTYKDIEYIIVDGKSTDNTIKIIDKYKDNIDFIISEEDGGIYDAMNKGIMHSSGDWIIFVNSGDIFASNDVLENIFSQERTYHVDVIYGNSIEVDSNGKKCFKMAKQSLFSIAPPIYRHGASFIRAEVHNMFMFDLTKINIYSYGLDYDCICRMYRAGKCFENCNETIIEYLKEGISNHKLKNLWLGKLIEHDNVKDFSLYRDFIFDITVCLIRKIWKKIH